MFDAERRKGDLPLYMQLADVLREQIASGTFRPGDRLPGEPVLTKQYQVSRATVAKALEQLEDDGLVRRRQGKGTFVQPSRMPRLLPELTGFSEHVRQLGHRPGHRLVDFRRLPAAGPEPLAAAFAESGVAEVVELRRLRFVDDQPVGIHRVVLAAPLAARIGLDAERAADPALSIYALLCEHHVGLARATEHLRARTATRDEAVALGVPRGEPLMQIRRFSWDPDGDLVEAVDAHYIGKRYDYRVDMTRHGPGPGADPASGAASPGGASPGADEAVADARPLVDANGLPDRSQGVRPGR